MTVMQTRLAMILTTISVFVVGSGFSKAAETDCETCVPSGIGGACAACGAGDKVCVTYAKPGTVEKHCWNVECEEVCIPAIRWPWQCRGWGEHARCDAEACADGCSTIACGKVRVVRRLKKETYEEDACVYEHRIECRCPVCCPVAQSVPALGVDALPRTEPIAPPVEPGPAPPQVSTPAQIPPTASSLNQTSLWTIMQGRRAAR